ncbi:bifunctional glycosyltransferase family 2 protein/CDP-glycerol:glycerophosphate glycerophosphotransferase [Streptomyces sp. ME02-8801-2C]|uniref:bifunctional glycosyltransferase/CDP-glycerol:glycerophosphate glycerophosphotransferase n=1 Tax=Streptomyces sp. ME02-8801-2C TaxID=3028680 RepID=UPI0029A1A1F5|nr:bifunctional glycosyltransferase family 2 protein/CDP-glycerol:glycerophosphate glycerophosphotransferase [Streptomyces sp. ME02-8801-2C]MDX3458262.1 bifunctional glycosyltransferase family 2 protein/CDP-glycerol:glycerophosphate glycerophosphotransferase [Streptomyces sp. ME02-8801-2C]
MPRFSVIVPAYRVQAYLQDCLESVLGQSYPDLEVIAVDDCSPDACGALVDEFAARDARVRPVHLPENGGVGAARNAGIDQATGDYLVFVDGDDTLAPNALRAVADRIKEAGEPDVLVYDHAHALWNGESVRSPFLGQLTEQGPVPFTLDDRPLLLKLPPVAWNKAYRREFVERENLTFPPGTDADLAWTVPALLAAESVATLDRVCVHHRRPRQHANSPVGLGHFDIHEQYDRVFAFVEARPELTHWRPVLFRRMVDQLMSALALTERLPSAVRAEFLRKSRAHYRRYRVPGATVPLYSRLRHLLVRTGSYRTYRAARLASALRRHLTRFVKSLARSVRSSALRLHYRVQRRLPLRADRAVFSSRSGRGYGCNPGALEAAFRSFVPGMRTAWVARPEHHHTLPTATARVRPGTAAYWTALARAKYLVSNGSWDERYVKRAGQVVIRSQDGTPLKRMGLDLQDRPAAARETDFAALLADVDTWDHCLSANRHSTLVWERVFPGGYGTIETGQPRNDVFQQATSADVARLRESLGIPEGSVAILYAPTHRDYRRGPRLTLDLERVLRQLGPRYVLLTRAHQVYDAPLTYASGGRLIDVTDHPSIESLCLASDALVTDYSSLMFDYANLDRPIVIHADDWEAYEAARGTYFDLRAFPPGAVSRSEDELIDIFATGHWRGSRSTQLRTAFRERFCPYDDGRAAERVVRRLVLGETARQVPVIPLAERHPVPSAAAAFAGAPLTSVPRPQAAPDGALTTRPRG